MKKNLVKLEFKFGNFIDVEDTTFTDFLVIFFHKNK